MSQNVFKMKMDKIVERCPGILCIHDDLCIYGHSEKEHNSNLLQLMQEASSNNLAFNSVKSQIQCPKVTFYSTIFSKEGMKPNPEKIWGITEMLHWDVQHLQSFLGMLAFMQPYIPPMTHHTAPFWELLKKIKDFTGMTTQIIYSRSWKHSSPRLTATTCSTTKEIFLSSSRQMLVTLAWVPAYTRMANN